MVKKAIKKQQVVEEPVKDVEEPKEEPKKKRIMSEEQLKHLAKIRELASAKKRELKERDTKARNLEKEALELKAKQYDKIQEEKAKLNEVKQEEKPKKKVKIIAQKEESSDDDGTSEEEVVQNKKSVRPKKITDIDDATIHQVAYKVSQDHLIKKIMSDRILNNLANYHDIIKMKYY